MIKKLQRKFVLIATGSLLAVLLLVLGAVNAVNFCQINRKADGILLLLAENGGKFPEPEPGRPHKPDKSPGFQMTEETRFETRYFTIRADASRVVTQIDTGHIAAVTSSQAREYAEQALSSGRTSGYNGYYKYLITETASGYLVVFVDCRSQMQTGMTFLAASLVIALACLLLVFLLVNVFSRRAIRPVVESMDKQKRFITDAGHEIKTPLAVISANTEVLELTNGQNEWTRSIRNQVKRLGDLVQQLLTLAGMEEGKSQTVFADFSLSDAVLTAAEPFATVAGAQCKRFALDIRPGLRLHGDESAVRALVSILVDNAVKYSNEGGEIRVSLTGNGKTSTLEVYNTGDRLPQGDLSRLFDRFYREDSSRSRETGGYGLGLSIAQAIVAAHKGKITAQNEDGCGIRFVVVF